MSKNKVKKKIMNKDEKRWIVLLIAVVIIAIVLFVSLGLSKNKKEGIADEGTSVTQGEANPNEKYVEVKEDGTKINISNKLKESKTFDELNISNINIETKNNETIVKADITNSTDEEKGDYGIYLKIVDDQGNEIKKIAGYISYMEPQGQARLSIKTSYDFANAYDFTIEKQ